MPAKLHERGPDLRIGGDAAGDDQRRDDDIGKFRAEALQAAAEAVGERVGYGALERGADVFDIAIRKRFERFRRQANGGLEAGKGKVERFLAL